MRPRSAPRPPRPLLLLLAAVASLGVAWALLVPPWQSPDEIAHFGYAQTLAEDHRLPGVEPGRAFSTEQVAASDAVNAERVASNLFAKPTWSKTLYDKWSRRALPEGARADGGGTSEDGNPNPARVNPPLYYAWESVSYLAASRGDIFGRLYLMRIWSVLLLLVAVSATWLLIGELTGPRPLLQLAGAAVVGLQPMAVFLSASINPDSLLIAATAVFLWLGARVLRRGLNPARGAALGGVLAAAILTKGAGYALFPATLVALVVGVARLRPGGSRRVAGLGVALAAGAPVALWLLFTRLADRPAINQVANGDTALGFDLPGPFSYLWQYYLPYLPGQAPLPESFPSLPVLDVWVRGGWANFGWLEVRFPDALYVLLAAITALLVAAGAIALVRHGLRQHLAVLAFMAAVGLGLVGGLHLTEYRIMRDSGVPFTQGRYLLPLLPLLGVCAAAGLTLSPPRWRALAAGVLTAGLFALQLFSLAIVAARFYA